MYFVDNILKQEPPPKNKKNKGRGAILKIKLYPNNELDSIRDHEHGRSNGKKL